MDERDRFEVWAAGHWTGAAALLRNSWDEYLRQDVQLAWAVWQRAVAPHVRDTARLDWLDAHPRVVIRSGTQAIRPLIDGAMQAQKL